MIAVDTSALVTISFDEAEGELVKDLIREADEPCVSTATVAETLIVLDNRTRDDNSELLRDMLFELGLVMKR